MDELEPKNHSNERRAHAHTDTRAGRVQLQLRAAEIILKKQSYVACQNAAIYARLAHASVQVCKCACAPDRSMNIVS